MHIYNVCILQTSPSTCTHAQGLKELLLGDREHPLAVLMVSALRAKLAPHLVPARPVLVDHFLNISNTPEMFSQRYAFLFSCQVVLALSALCGFINYVIIVYSLKNNYSLRGGGRWPTAVAYSRVGGEFFPPLGAL